MSHKLDIKDTSTPRCWCRLYGRDFWEWRRRGTSPVEGCRPWPGASSASPFASSSTPLHSWWPALRRLRWSPSWLLHLRQSPKGESTHKIIPTWGAEGPPLPITLLGSRPAYPECAPLPPSPPSLPHPQSQTSPRDSGPVTEKAPSAGEITAEGLEEQLALLWFKFRAWSTSRAMLGNGKTGGSAGVRGRSLERRGQNNPSKLSGSGSESSAIDLWNWTISLQYWITVWSTEKDHILTFIKRISLT